MKSSSGGQGGGTFSGRSPGSKSCGGASEALLKELVARLQEHSKSLRRDIRRLQRALVEINGAIALSLDRVERLRANTDRLHAIFGDVPQDDGQSEESKPRKDRRSGAERRTGGDRRRARSEVTGLLRWIEGTSLDRRRAPERRTAQDRRRIIEVSTEKRDRLVVPMTSRRRACGDVISLADYRRSRKAAPGKSRP